MTFEKFMQWPSALEIIQKNLHKKLNHQENSIMAVYFLQERKKMYASYFHSYFKMLPNSFENFPIFFSQKDKDFLKGTLMLEMIEQEIKEIEEDYDMICKELLLLSYKLE